MIRAKNSPAMTETRRAAEELMREMAFVLEMTRKAKEVDLSDMPGWETVGGSGRLGNRPAPAPALQSISAEV